MDSETPFFPSDAVVSGIVITFSKNSEASARAFAKISAHSAISVRLQKDRWLPIVVEARDQCEFRCIRDWLSALEGVEFVDVVSINSVPEDEAVLA